MSDFLKVANIIFFRHSRYRSGFECFWVEKKAIILMDVKAQKVVTYMYVCVAWSIWLYRLLMVVPCFPQQPIMSMHA